MMFSWVTDPAFLEEVVVVACECQQMLLLFLLATSLTLFLKLVYGNEHVCIGYPMHK